MVDLSYSVVDLLLLRIVDVDIKPETRVTRPIVTLARLYLDRDSPEGFIANYQIILRDIACERCRDSSGSSQHSASEVFADLANNFVREASCHSRH